MIFDEPSKKPLPQQTSEDVAHTAGKALVAMIPVLGGGAVELLGLLNSPIAQRRDEWLSDLARRLHELEHRVEGFRFDQLAENMEFVTATLQAGVAADRTNAEDKRQALRNAVLNIAAGAEPDKDLQSLFLSWLDALTPLHLRLLVKFKAQQPVRIAEAPDWLKADVCPQVAKDLLDRGLLAAPSHLVADRERLITGENGTYRFNVGLSRLGDHFLSFITSPLDLAEA